MRVSKVLKLARTFLSAEFRNVRQFDLPWRYRLWLYSRGFLSSNGALWEPTAGTVDRYLSDIEYHRSKRIDRPYSQGLKNKLLFRLLVARTHDHLLPDLYGLVRDGRFVESERFGTVGSVDQLIARLADESVVLKPVQAAKGAGIHVLEWTDGQVHVDGRPVRRETVRATLADGPDLLAEERVQQADYAAEIVPGSTNTIRLLTMVDPESGDPFIATASHRFGTDASGHRDNWSAGGISAGVELDSGRLGRAVRNPATAGDVGGRLATHPETGARIEGVEVPGWQRITATVRDLAAEYGSLWPQVGWDVVVRDGQGSIAVLEGEPQSVDSDQQAHGPLLADQRVRRFYEHHGVLSKRLRGRGL